MAKIDIKCPICNEGNIMTTYEHPYYNTYIYCSYCGHHFRDLDEVEKNRN